VPGILVVERSTTLNHLLQRTLQAAQVGSWEELHSFADALDHLQRVADMGQSYQFIITGSPPRSSRDFEELLIFLRNPRQARIPLLVLGLDKLPVVEQLLGQRAETHFLPWTQFARIPALVRQVMPVVEPALAEEAGAAAAEAMAGMVGAPSPELALPHLIADGVRVLFVDDSASVRIAYRQLLDRHGYLTETAGSISEGYLKAAGGAFDVMVIDYFLPDGNGDELCRRLKQNPATADAAISIITGTYREDVVKRCLEAGAVECTFKNEAKELFLARIGGLARHAEMRRAKRDDAERMQRVLGMVGDGVLALDGEARISYANPAAAELLGYANAAELIGRPAAVIVPAAPEDGTGSAAVASELLPAINSGQALAAAERMLSNQAGQALCLQCALQPTGLARGERGSVLVFRDTADRHNAERLHWESLHDALTGLSNARHFSEAVSAELAHSREHGGYAALLYIDIDRYTHVVDAGGPASGEQLVMDLAQAYKKRLREGDVLARLEGDRMALLLTGVTLDNLFTIADGFRELAHQCNYQVNRHARRATVSIGVAILSRDTPSAEYLIEHARVACKDAKHRGRDQTQIYVGEHDARVARELEAGWIARFRDALEQNRFEFDVQPIVAMASLPENEDGISEQHGWRLGDGSHEALFEILIRMRDRRGEIVAPGVFVPLAERVGMMPKIDLWVVQHALDLLSRVGTALEQIAFNINLSNQTLADGESMALIVNAIRGSGVPARALVFEITETSEMTSMYLVRKTMQSLRELGCRFALDDFGTGFSSFTHLRHLPVDFVKIEGSFVEGMADNELDHTMVASIAGLARSMKLAVIGEHVDNFATLRALRKCGVEYAQGNYLGAPRKFAEIDFAALLPVA